MSCSYLICMYSCSPSNSFQKDNDLVKVKLPLVLYWCHAMQMYGGQGGTAACILNPSARWGGVVSFMPPSCFFSEEAGWAPDTMAKRKILPFQEWNPGHWACSLVIILTEKQYVSGLDNGQKGQLNSGGFERVKGEFLKEKNIQFWVQGSHIFYFLWS